MQAEEICVTAAALVSGDRHKTHGDKFVNHENIARMWNAYLECKFGIVLSPTLSPLDVAQMMGLLKTARTCLGAHNLDDYVDQAGYAGVAGEIAERMNQDEMCNDLKHPRAGETAQNIRTGTD